MSVFLNPTFLGALALVGVPLLIHLIRKRKLRVVRWAAMDFLRESQRKQRKRLRIEELILLALRMLIVALAVLAFARPVLRSIGIPLLSQNARVYAIVVLDNSFSMGQRGADGKTSWTRATAATDAILTKILKSGDSASLILMADKPDPAVNAASFDLNYVVRKAHTAQISDRGTDYFATARMVDNMLKASKAPFKEVYWLSDDQQTAWDTSKKDAAHAVWQDIAKQSRLTWVSVGAPPDNRDNLAVEMLPLGREMVTSHLQARLEVKVSNYGVKSRDNLLVNLIIDGRPAGSNRISLTPHSAKTVAFTPTFPQTGTHTGRIELADPSHVDNLEKDNGAPFVVRSRDRIKVLVQDMHPSSDPAKSESFYIMNAMAPGGETESLAPKLREGTGLSGVNLRDYDAVIITGITGLSSADQHALNEYVRGGGGLLIFPGPSTSSGRVNTDLNAAELLPAKLGAQTGLSFESAATLNPASINGHPAMTMFKDTSSVNLGGARFTRYVNLEPTTEGVDPNTVRVMIRFNNGDPAFVERSVGLGKVVLSASTAGAAWNQLPLKSSYVPLVFQIVSYLGAGPSAHRNLHQDEQLFLSLPLSDANKPVRITRPDGRVVTQNSILDARGVTFTFADTRQSGTYKVAVTGSNTQDAFAVSLTGAESDLTAPVDIKQAITKAGVPGERLTLANTPAAIQASVLRSRYGAEVWRTLIYIVIGLLFLESLLAQLFGRRG